jgi:hypothetical protein
VYEVVGGIDTAVAAFGIGLGIHDWNDDRRGSLVMVTGFGAQILALSAALAVSRDATDAVLEESLVYAPAVVGLSMAVSSRTSDAERTMGVGLAIGSFGVSAVVGANSALRRTPVSRMRRHARVLDSSLQISGSEFHEMEADYVGTRDPLPRFLLALPSLVGGAITLSPAFDEATSPNDQALAFGLSGVQFLNAMVFLGTVDPVDAYCRNAVGACAKLVASRHGFALVGRF